MRDMSREQFDTALKRRGFEPTGFLGYWRLPLAGRNHEVCAYNGGPRRRDRLAYLLRALAKAEQQAT